MDNSDRAAELKNLGNEELKKNNFDEAVKFYTQAIELAPSPIFYSNRAQAHIKLENYGLAISDATKSIELDPSYLKAYYRRAVAESAILEYKKSLADVKKVLSKAPKDPSCVKLHADLTKVLKAIAFENAIAINEKQSPIEELDFDSMIVENGYKGPELDIKVTKIGKAQKVEVDMTLDYVNGIIEVFKRGEKIPKKHAFAIVSVANDIFKSEPPLVEIGLSRENVSGEKKLDGCEKITVCGDTHGQFYDVLNIFESFGAVGPQHTYLFNGDFVDRGSWSCEVAILFYCFKILYPDRFYLNRGNHETNDMNQVYGFADECKAKYSHKLFLCFSESFNSLPYATLIGQEYLVMHGGLFSDDSVTVEDIRKIRKVTYKQPPKEGIEMELLWTDPQPEKGRAPSKRGIGIQFGPDVTAKFCEANNLKAIIRSHEVRMGGYELEHDGKLITVFSAPNYCDSQHNLGAVINMTLDSSEYKLDFVTFKEVPHPDIGPMAYTRNMGF